MENKLSVFYVTFPDYSSAVNMANLLINNKLAGCCNVIQNVQSIYSWNGKIENSDEVIMIIKTIDDKADDLLKFIENNHKYEVPCILNLNDGKINQSYYEWIKSQVE